MVRSLAERMRTHEQQKARLAEQEAKLKDAERRARTRRLIEAGGLIEKTGLLDLDANALYGALLSLRDGAPGRQRSGVGKWTALGGRTFAHEATPARRRSSEPVIDHLRRRHWRRRPLDAPARRRPALEQGHAVTGKASRDYDAGRQIARGPRRHGPPCRRGRLWGRARRYRRRHRRGVVRARRPSRPACSRSGYRVPSSMIPDRAAPAHRRPTLAAMALLVRLEPLVQHLWLGHLQTFSNRSPRGYASRTRAWPSSPCLARSC